MIYLIIGIFSTVTILITYLLTNKWVSNRAFAVLNSNGKWEVVSIGWESIWLPMLIGALAAFAVFCIIKAMFSESLHALIMSRVEDAHREENQALSELREQLARKQSSIDAEIKKIAAIKAKEANLEIEELKEKNKDLTKKMVYLINENAKIIGRMKGAQQKASRMKKKAQLMSLEEAKPNI